MASRKGLEFVKVLEGRELIVYPNFLLIPHLGIGPKVCLRLTLNSIRALSYLIFFGLNHDIKHNHILLKLVGLTFDDFDLGGRDVHILYGLHIILVLLCDLVHTL